jgi:hypothetical protein
MASLFDSSIQRFCKGCSVERPFTEENWYLSQDKWPVCRLCQSRRVHEHYLASKSVYHARVRKQRLERHDAVLTKERTAARLNYQRNPGRMKAHVAARRAWIAQATVSWANLAAIKDFYEDCPPGYHVDHIHPLKGREVCGLHVWENLQYLPAKENMSKGNRFHG